MARAGSRQAVRAAARGFVRRHRRDRGYLAFVLRGVLANSALAVALLGLAPAPSHAAATLFAAQTGAANPLNGQDVGTYSAPALGDLDGDGDLDLVAGHGNGVFRYYENTGTAAAPAYALRTGSANPLAGRDVGFDSTPALGDLDGDGDLDLVAGERDGAFFYFENTGSATLPSFAPRTGAANPLAGQDVGTYSTPALGDLDGDGDLDLVAGERDGTFLYYANTGTRTAPAFAPRTGVANPLAGKDVGYASAPALGDLDGDGDADLVAGERYGGFAYYENTGSVLLPAFALRGGEANPLAGQSAGVYSTVALGDLDGDGDLDVVAGESNGGFAYYANLSRGFVLKTGAANPIGGQDVGAYSAPALGDLDGDGDLDVVSGALDGTFLYYQNTGSASVPAFALRTGAANPLNGQDAGDNSLPALGDLDGDGDLDLVAGNSDGTFFYYQNTGSALVPAFIRRTGSANPMDGQDVGFDSAPAIVDLDGDGDRDLIAGGDNGTSAPALYYYQNTGSATVPAFAPRVVNPFNIVVTPGVPRPGLGDFDGDGDFDLAIGNPSPLGPSSYYENTGSKSAPAFALRAGSASPLASTFSPSSGDLDGDGDVDILSGDGNGTFSFHENAIVRPAPRYIGPTTPLFAGIDVGSFSAPAAADLDGDGDPDFVASDEFTTGVIHYFENTGSALLPKVAERTGAANPFDGLSAGFTARLALGDVDADGDFDLVSGQTYGNPLLFFENTGTSTTPHFVQRTGAANPFDAVIVTRAAPAFADLDADGDLDLVIGESGGTFHTFANTGDAEAPAFVELTGAANPLNGQSVGAGIRMATPALADVDRDGDLDLVAGEEEQGQFHYFENTGSAIAAAFVARTGAANPLDGKDVGLNSSPTFADLDGDGDLDVVSGERYGALLPFYLPEPSHSLLFGAGVLAWLARWRRRAAAWKPMR